MLTSFCPFCANTVLAKGRQIRGGDQGSHRQTQGGKLKQLICPVDLHIQRSPACKCWLLATQPTSSCMTANAWLSSSLQAETRAEFAERSVAKLEKTIDDLEGMNLLHLIFRPRKSLFVSSLVKKKSTKTVVFRHQNGCLHTCIKGNYSLTLQCEIISLLVRRYIRHIIAL